MKWNDVDKNIRSHVPESFCSDFFLANINVLKESRCPVLELTHLAFEVTEVYVGRLLHISAADFRYKPLWEFSDECSSRTNVHPVVVW